MYDNVFSSQKGVEYLKKRIHLLILQVDMSCLPSASSVYPQSATNVFVCLHFYVITFSSRTTPISVDELSKEWHVIDNHILQVRQVKPRSVSFQQTSSTADPIQTLTSSASNQPGIVGRNIFYRNMAEKMQN
jgi:hypothetical protein